MKITGTEKIRKVLDIPSLKIQISKDQIFNINDDHLWNTDIQTAINLGYITTDSNQQESQDTSNKIKFTNVSKKSVVLSGLLINFGKTYQDAFVKSSNNKKKNKDILASVTVVAGGSFFINEKDEHNSDLQSAVAQGLLVKETTDQELPNTETNTEMTNVSEMSVEINNPDKLDFNDELIIKSITNKDKDDPRVAMVIADPNQTRNDTIGIEGSVSWDGKTTTSTFVDEVKPHPVLTKKAGRKPRSKPVENNSEMILDTESKED